MNHIVSGNCMDGAKKGGFCYTNRNFCQEDNREEERWWLQCSGTPIIVRVDHLQHEYHDAPKFGSALLSSAVWPKFRVTLYGTPTNVKTLRFCWCPHFPCFHLSLPETHILHSISVPAHQQGYTMSASTAFSNWTRISGLVLCRLGSAWKPRLKLGLQGLRLVEIEAWAVSRAWGRLGLRPRLMMGKMNGLRKIIDKNLINRYITFTSWCIPSLLWPSSVTKEKSWDEQGLSKKMGKKNTPASLWAHFHLLFNDFTGTKSERIFSL